MAAIVDTRNSRAIRARGDLADRYAFVPEAEADVGVVVGGDGFMLRTLHRLLGDGVVVSTAAGSTAYNAPLAGPFSADRAAAGHHPGGGLPPPRLARSPDTQ
jgi:NAD kinase